MDNFDVSAFVLQIMETFSNLFTTFTSSLNELVALTGITVDIPIIGDWTLFGLMLGGGLVFYIVICLVSWVSPL